MKIIIEGADLTGKSILTDKLAKDLSMPTRQRIVRVGPQKVKQEHKQDFAEHDGYVLDRCYAISDYIYETLYGNTSVFSFNDIVQEVQREDCLYIIILASKTLLEQRYAVRGDDDHTFATIWKANKLYMQLASNLLTQPNVTILHAESYSYSQLLKRLEAYV